jgi:hypothetical protein
MGAMPLIALGALTILILAIAVWASVSQESDASMIGEGEPAELDLAVPRSHQHGSV